MRRILIAAATALGWVSAAAAADDLHLDGDRYWLALASRANANAAIGVARWYQALSPSVVRAADGSYAVISGPRTVPAGSASTAIAALLQAGSVPAGTALTRGEAYESVVWTSPPSPILASIHYDGRTDARLALGPLALVLSKTAAARAGAFTPTATATFDGKPAFVMAAESRYPSDAPASDAYLMKLDPTAPEPQVVFTYFWQGAHCCTLTRIATEHPDGTWQVVDGERLDGGGYRFEDLTGTGEIDLTSGDQIFLYAFSSYASSVAPTRIHRLVGDHLVDVTREPRFYDVLLQSVAALESSVKPDDPAWHDNGFLAGWVAEKMLVGQGGDAWTRMLATYDRSPDAGPERCTMERPLAECPDDRKARIPFPVALKAFLIEHGYILDAALYPIPHPADAPAPVRAVAAPPSGIPPELQRCVADSDSARRLIYQAFVGRRLQPNESYDPVSLEADTTLEANDTSIGRIVCAVTYDVDLKRLAAQLSAHGEAARAAAIDKLMRTAGPVSTARIKYSVKPTATPGQNYVELLP